MAPPPKQRFNRDFEIDLDAELGLDNPYSSRKFPSGKMVLVVAGVCLCLAGGVTVGYLATRRGANEQVTETDPEIGSTRLLEASSTPALSEAGQTVQRRLSGVALEEAGDVVGLALQSSRGLAGAPRSEGADARSTSSRRRSRRDDQHTRSGPLVPFALEPEQSMEQRLAPLLDIEQTDPYTRDR